MSGVLLAHEPAETLSVRDIRTQRARCSVTINTSLLLHLSYSLQTDSKSQHISTGDGNQTETEPKFESNRTEPNEPNLQCCMRVPSVIRPIDVSRKLLSFTGEHCFRFFVNTRFHQPRRGRPWNVYRRFGRRWSFINGSRDLAHPFPIFIGGDKSAKFGLIFNITRLWATSVWKNSKISQTQLWNKFVQRWWSPYVPMFSPSLVKIGPRIPENHPEKVPHPA